MEISLQIGAAVVVLQFSFAISIRQFLVSQTGADFDMEMGIVFKKSLLCRVLERSLDKKITQNKEVKLELRKRFA